MPGTSTAPEGRTPEWFTSQYLEHLAYLDGSETRRLVHLSDSDTDSESDGQRRLRGKRRKLRHISRADVLSLLALHAKWLVANQTEQRVNKIFDPLMWDRWARESRYCREQLTKESLGWEAFRWQIDSFREREGSDSSSSDDYMSVDSDEPAQPLQTKQKRKGLASKRTRRGRELPPELEEDAAESYPYPRASPAPSQTFSNHYDSDFTTDGASSSGSDWESDSLPSCDATPLPNGLPLVLLQSPEIPIDSGSWICPVEGCLYEIDFRSLTNAQAAIIGRGNADRIMLGKWCFDDIGFLRCFHWLVSEHYEEHGKACGISKVRDGNKWKLVVSQAPARPLDAPPENQVVVKEESEY